MNSQKRQDDGGVYEQSAMMVNVQQAFFISGYVKNLSTCSYSSARFNSHIPHIACKKLSHIPLYSLTHPSHIAVNLDKFCK